MTSFSTESLEERFLSLYSPAVGTAPFSTIQKLVTSLNWTDPLKSSSTAYFDKLGINGTFTREEVESALRVNYGQVRDRTVSVTNAN